MSSLAPSVRQRIRQLRLDAGLSQRRLATGVNCTQQTIHGIEAGEHGMSLALASRLAEALNVPIGELLAEREPARR